MRLLMTICFLIGIIPLSAQSNKYTINVSPCYKFDVEKFEENEVNGVYEFYLKDGLKVTQAKTDQYYEEAIIQEGTPLRKRRFYYLNTGMLWSESNSFYNCVTGITKVYDEAGKLISEKNEDAPYLFSINDVVKKVKQEFDIDLTKPIAHMHVNRGSDYSVAFGLKSGESIFSGMEAIMLDGATGEIYYHAKGNDVFIDKRPELNGITTEAP